MTKDTYKVAIIGRANVGKSTLFNRLGETHKALVADVPHTTRDRKFLQINWNNIPITLIDTGGMEITSKDLVAKEIIVQAKIAIFQSDFVLLLVDAQTGIVPEDRALLKLIQNSKKEFLVVANKADNQKYRDQAENLKKIGVKEIIKISALNGSGTGDLLDRLTKNLNKNNFTNTAIEKPVTKIAIVGKPNVGKSSLINAILGEKRVIVSPVAFTTRESIDVPFQYKGEDYLFIDTAGLRKKRRVADGLEKAGAGQSRLSIKRADIVLLVTDASEPLSTQEKMIAREIQDGLASLIILANKWDLIEKNDEKTIIKYEQYYHNFFPFLAWAPLQFVSAINKKGVKQILDLIIRVKNERSTEITENALSKFLKVMIKKYQPKGKSNRSVNRGAVKSRRPFIHHLLQIKTNPPIFSLKIVGKIDLDYTYIKYIEKCLREKFGFLGTPLKIQIEKSNK